MSIPQRTVRSAFLVNERSFPQDPVELEPVLSKMYLEMAYAVNARTIGTFNTFQVTTGELWLGTPQNQRTRQSFREVYPIGPITAGATLTVPHGLVGLTAFTDIYGTCITDVPDYRPLPYASVGAASNIELKCDSINIIISVGAASPNIVSAIVVLEYLLS